MAEQKQSETGAEIVTKEAFSSDRTNEVRYPAGSTSKQRYRYESKADLPPVLRQSKGVADQDQAEPLLEASQGIARQARDAFKEACAAADTDQAEVNFLAVKDKLNELWNFSHLRDRPFRDLLGLLQAAILHSDLPDIGESQRDVLRQAFADLPKLFLEDSLVEQYIDRFAEHGLDGVIGPIQPPRGKRIKITIEEID